MNWLRRVIDRIKLEIQYRKKLKKSNEISVTFDVPRSQEWSTVLSLRFSVLLS